MPIRTQLAAGLLSAALAPALFAADTGEIRGFAFGNDGKPISGATITLSGAASQTITAAKDGSFDFPNLAPGHYQVAASEAKRELISDTSVSLNLTAGQTLEADVTVGASTHHYGFFKRVVRHLSGQSQ